MARWDRASRLTGRDRGGELKIVQQRPTVGRPFLHDLPDRGVVIDLEIRFPGKLKIADRMGRPSPFPQRKAWPDAMIKQFPVPVIVNNRFAATPSRGQRLT